MSSTFLSDVRRFMSAVNQATPERFTLGGFNFKLRASLIIEEAFEYIEASGLMSHENRTWLARVIEDHIDQSTNVNDAEMVDALIDILYVTYGALVAMGIGNVALQSLWDEVHKKNMEKTTGPVRDDGKRLKPEGWTPPDIVGILAKIKSENISDTDSIHDMRCTCSYTEHVRHTSSVTNRAFVRAINILCAVHGETDEAANR